MDEVTELLEKLEAAEQTSQPEQVDPTGEIPQTGKRQAKNSVFLDMMQMERYQRQFYQALHPEDTQAGERKIELFTLTNSLINNIYNDLGLMVDNHLIILAEAQSTWSVNVLIRILMYLVESYRRHFHGKNGNLYGSKPVQLPTAEAYIIYTKKDKPEMDGQVLSLTDVFFGGIPCAVDLRATVLCDPDSRGVIGEYIKFCVILDEQRRRLGNTMEAMRETLRLCMENNTLVDYLKERESEVINMVINLYNDKEILEMMIHGSREEGREEGRDEGWMEGQLASIRNLSTTMNISAREAMNLLRILPNEQEKYEQLLAQ